MFHEIPPDQHGPLALPMIQAIEACVHCGFCLAACPTYQELGQEMDSPRGRIVLMKEVLEGKLPWVEVQPHVDRCLGCLACEPACPSGVPYRNLISPFRALAQSHFVRSPWEKIRRTLTSQTVPHPSRFRVAASLGRVSKAFSALLPQSLKPMLDLLPGALPARVHLAKVNPARGERRARVALLAGCAQQVLDPDINVATIDVLTRHGVEVLVPSGQVCCGGLAWHTGDLPAAQDFARRNLDAFPSDVDAILTNAAGCGSAMHEYHLILRGTDDEARADAFRKRVMDVSVFLHRIGLREKPHADRRCQRIAYHDACHLANAQNVRREPRELLKAIPGVQLIELTDPHLCCGSAGSYNMDQPAIANSLGAQKAKAVLVADVSIVASGNIGCLTQLQVHLKRLGSSVKVRHTFQILRDAYAAADTTSTRIPSL